jgi:hypothetical protein
MPATNPDPDGWRLPAPDPLQHELRTALTIVLGRTHLLLRTLQHAPPLTEAECGRLVQGLVAIQTAARSMVPRIAILGDAAPTPVRPARKSVVRHDAERARDAVGSPSGASTS